MASCVCAQPPPPSPPPLFGGAHCTLTSNQSGNINDAEQIPCVKDPGVVEYTIECPSQAWVEANGTSCPITSECEDGFCVDGGNRVFYAYTFADDGVDTAVPVYVAADPGVQGKLLSGGAVHLCYEVRDCCCEDDGMGKMICVYSGYTRSYQTKVYSVGTQPCFGALID